MIEEITQECVNTGWGEKEGKKETNDCPIRRENRRGGGRGRDRQFISPQCYFHGLLLRCDTICFYIYYVPCPATPGAEFNDVISRSRCLLGRRERIKEVYNLPFRRDRDVPNERKRESEKIFYHYCPKRLVQRCGEEGWEIRRDQPR